MKTKIKTILAFMIIAAFIAGNAFAGAECGAGGQHNKGFKGKEAIAKELNLSADQQASLEKTRSANREGMEALRAALKDKKRELQEAIAKPDTKRTQVEPILAQIKKLQSDMADKRVDGIFAVKGILSQEQFAKLESIKEERAKDGHKEHDTMKRR